MAWVLLMLSLTANVARKDAEMRTIVLTVEMPDTHYMALKRRVARFEQKVPEHTWTLDDEIEYTAQSALISEAEQELKREALERERKDDNMPRQRGFVGMETGDAEYLSLMKEIRDGQNSNDTGSLPEDKGLITTSVPDSGRLTKAGGVFNGPSGKETWYNLPMSGVIDIMRIRGYDEETYPYRVREDGCRMLGDYIMVAADHRIRPIGTLVETSLGTGIVCDTGSFIHENQMQIDIAVDW